MKKNRQQVILEIIAEQEIATQEELVDALRARNFDVTQATVSRDIKKMNLIKTTAENGRFRYTAGKNSDGTFSDRLKRMFGDSVVSAQYAQNMVVLKTLPGTAGVAAEAVDNMDLPEILGTMAGENTIFIVTHDTAQAQAVTQLLSTMIG